MTAAPSLVLSGAGVLSTPGPHAHARAGSELPAVVQDTIGRSRSSGLSWAAPGSSLTSLSVPGGGAEPRSRKEGSIFGDWWDLAEALRPFAVAKSLRNCGLVPVPETAGVEVRRATDRRIEHPETWTDKAAPRVWFGGLRHCESPWSCPVCAVRLAAERAEELSRVVALWGGAELVELGTFTIAHRKHHELRPMWRGMNRAWKRLQDSAGFRALVDDLGVEVVRGLEATRNGYTGWHPHFHVLIFCMRPLDDDTRTRMRDVLSAEWESAVLLELGEEHRPSAERGVDLRPARSSKYIAKLGLELTSTMTKDAEKGGHLSPWAIARKAAEGRGRYVHLWREWQTAMAGARALNWPRAKHSHLRRLREIVAADLEREATAREGASELVTTIPIAIWRRVIGARSEIRDCVIGGGDEADVFDVISDHLAGRRLHAPPD